MRIGYACQTVAVPGTVIRRCALKNASPGRLLSLVSQNLTSLENMLDYNIHNGIRLYRISSDLIPFGSGAAATLPWEQLFSDRLSALREKISASGMRVSMHPGQYTVLNSPDADVVRRAVMDLAYHARVLDALAPGAEHKLVLHIGGKYGEPRAAARRFLQHCRDLDDAIRRRLVLENDGQIYPVSEVLDLALQAGAPVVYDNLHNALNPADTAKSDAYWIDACAKTWHVADGAQKVHYSQQHPAKTRGAHSETIAIDGFLDFYHGLPDEKPDIMLEVKDKNRSALKCILCASPHPVSALEAEWARYKYAVLERSPSDYAQIRALLTEKRGDNALAFYHLVERALETEEDAGRAVAALEHVWGYFKRRATPAEARRFLQKRARFLRGETPLRQAKSYLYRLAEKYDSRYLLGSYYFTD